MTPVTSTAGSGGADRVHVGGSEPVRPGAAKVHPGPTEVHPGPTEVHPDPTAGQLHAAVARTQEDVHPGRVLAVLSSEDRLRVFAAAVLAGPATAAALASAGGVEGRAASSALDALAAAGLVAPDAAGRWSPRPDALGRAARTAAQMRRTVQPEDLGATGEQAAVLRGFWSDGRLGAIPTQRSKRQVVLDFLAQQFEPGRTYPEARVNRMLERHADDYATLRRLLVDEGFLERRGGFYWRAGGTFEVD